MLGAPGGGGKRGAQPPLTKLDPPAPATEKVKMPTTSDSKQSTTSGLVNSLQYGSSAFKSWVTGGSPAGEMFPTIASACKENILPAELSTCRLTTKLSEPLKDKDCQSD